jgi:hypothetical protein
VNNLFRSLRTENGDLRGRTGSGEPGLYTLLGGTGTEKAGSAGAAGGYSKLATPLRDVRVSAAAAAAAAAAAGWTTAGRGAQRGNGGARLDREK